MSVLVEKHSDMTDTSDRRSAGEAARARCAAMAMSKTVRAVWASLRRRGIIGRLLAAFAEGSVLWRVEMRG